MVDGVLQQLSRRLDAMYVRVGRPTIPPEQLLRAKLLQMLYSIRQRTAADGSDRLQHDPQPLTWIVNRFPTAAS
jgi:hypothetical protein